MMTDIAQIVKTIRLALMATNVTASDVRTIPSFVCECPVGQAAVRGAVDTKLLCVVFEGVRFILAKRKRLRVEL